MQYKKRWLQRNSGTPFGKENTTMIDDTDFSALTGLFGGGMPLGTTAGHSDAPHGDNPHRDGPHVDQN